MARSFCRGFIRRSVFVVIVTAFLASSTLAWAMFSGIGSTATQSNNAGAIGAPTSFTAIPADPTTATLSWTAPSNPSPTGYTLTQSSGTLAGTCTTLTATTTTCTATGLTATTAYTWTLSATYQNWTSPPVTAGASTSKVTPTITTTASPSTVTVGGSVADQATLTLGYSPTGTITWKLYASTDTTCSGTVYFTSSAQTVNGNTLYTSSSFTTTAAGSYQWSYSYTGDANNNGVSACGGTNEALTVNQATPSLSTSATASVSVGGTVADTATLANGYNPTGTITYTLYGPSATQSCTTQVGQVTTSASSGNGNYTSPTITPTKAGTYWWIANYGGNSNNAVTTNGCGASGESSVVQPVTPTITTTASPATVTVGGSVDDQAAVSLGYSPTGTITWKLYASTDTTCSGTVYFTSSAQTVNGNALYTSSSFTTTAAGSYKWGYSYTGDANNNPVTACGGDNESLTVSQATTILSSSAITPVSVGGAASDTATIANGYNPTGDVTWALYGGTVCTGTPVFTTSSVGAVSGNGNYTSANFTTTAVGTFTWKVSYGGDTNNSGASACGGTGETLTVVNATTTTATGPATDATGTAIAASAISSVFTGGTTSPAVTGTITFTVFGPQASAPTICTAGGTPVGTATVSGNNTYHPSAGFTPNTSGTYWWYASYGGDVRNGASNSTCGSGMSSTVVSPTPTASNIDTTNGSTAGTIDTNDTVVFTFSQAMNPASILAGFTGASTSVDLCVSDATPNVLKITTGASSACGSAPTVHLGSVSLGTNNYTSANAWAEWPATIAFNGADTILTITLSSGCADTSNGNCNSKTSGVTTNTTFTWTPSASATSQGGVAMSTTPVNSTTKEHF